MKRIVRGARLLGVTAGALFILPASAGALSLGGTLNSLVQPTGGLTLGAQQSEQATTLGGNANAGLLDHNVLKTPLAQVSDTGVETATAGVAAGQAAGHTTLGLNGEVFHDGSADLTLPVVGTLPHEGGLDLGLGARLDLNDSNLAGSTLTITPKTVVDPGF